MKEEEIEAICTERLNRWQHRLIDEHATPVILVGISHDEKSQLVICTTEDMTDEQIATFLRGVLNKFVLDRKAR